MASLAKQALAFVFIAQAALAAGAADCPKPDCFIRTVMVVVPFAAGGPTDQVARAWATQLSKQLGQAVVVENKPGAAGAIAMAAVAHAAPDSYTILVTNQGPITISPLVVTRMPVDPAKDLVAAARIAVAPQVLVARTDRAYTNLKEFADYAQKRPGNVTFGSPGNASLGHLLGERFSSISGAKLQHVTYRGQGPALSDLRGGQLDSVFTDLGAVSEDIKAGRLRALAVSGERRTGLNPEIPTFAELGVRGADSGWIGAFFPAKTDPAIISRLNTETRKALADPEFQKRLRDVGLEDGALDSAAFARTIASETAGWTTLVKQANIKAD